MNQVEKRQKENVLAGIDALLALYDAAGRVAKAAFDAGRLELRRLRDWFVNDGESLI